MHKFNRLLLVVVTVLLHLNGITGATTCLNQGQLAISIDGGPSSITPELLGTLRKLGVTTLFNLDSEKLASGGVQSLMEGISRDGHILGLSLNKELDINSMTSEGLRGVVDKRTRDFYNSSGKFPLFVRVPSDTSAEKMNELGSSGYLIIKPSLDMSKVWSGNCEATFNTTVNKSLFSKGSITVSISDSEYGCSVEEISLMIASAQETGFEIVRMDKCINLGNPYRLDPSDYTPLSFSLSDDSSVATTISLQPTSVNTVGQQSTENSASPNQSTAFFLSLGLLVLLKFFL